MLKEYWCRHKILWFIVDAHDILREILVHLIRDEGVTKARKLAYLNALVRYYKELSHNEELGFTDAQLIYWYVRLPSSISSFLFTAYNVMSSGHVSSQVIM